MVIILTFSKPSYKPQMPIDNLFLPGPAVKSDSSQQPAQQPRGVAHNQPTASPALNAVRNFHQLLRRLLTRPRQPLRHRRPPRQPSGASRRPRVLSDRVNEGGLEKTTKAPLSASFRATQPTERSVPAPHNTPRPTHPLQWTAPQPLSTTQRRARMSRCRSDC